MSSSKFIENHLDTGIINFVLLDANKEKVEGGFIGNNIRLANTLLTSMISKEETNLFSQSFDVDTKEILYFDSDKKNIKLSSKHKKMLLLLAPQVSDDATAGDKKLKDYVDRLPNMVMRGGSSNLDYTLPVNLNLLAKAFYGGKAIGGKNLDNTIKVLEELSHISRVCKVKDYEGTEYTLRNSNLITFKQLSIKNEGKNVNVHKAYIQVHDIMLYGLTTTGEYQIAPRNLGILWAKYGNDTEIFGQLFLTLINQRGFLVGSYYKALKKAKTKQNKNNIINTKEKYLSYEISAPKLLDLTKQERYTYKNKPGYIRWKNFLNDLKEAVECLKNIGIITKFETGKNTAGEEKYIFILNENWVPHNSDDLAMIEA